MTEPSSQGAVRRVVRDLRGAAPIVVYYLATPLFALADALGWGPLRVAGITDPTVRWVYYGVLFALGWVVRRFPRGAGPVALAEGTANLILLFLSVLGPVWGLLDDVDGSAMAGVDLPSRILNLVVVGGMTVYALNRTIRTLDRDTGRRRS